MAKISNLSKDKPTQFDVIHMLKNNIFSTLNCHNIGRILEFDPKTQTCTVEMLQIKQYNAKTFKPAPITNVPLIILGTKNANITFPDPVGTICVLIFMDRNMDSFMETEESYVPSTTRMHDFTDCIALCTFKTLANPIKDYDENAISLVNTGLANEVENSTSLKVYPNLMEVLTNGKVKIANDTQSLAKLMQDFLSACAAVAIDVNTGTLTTESKQNFANLKTYFAELLSDTGYTGVSGGGGSVNTSDTSTWAALISSIENSNSNITSLQTSVKSLQTSVNSLNTNKFTAPNYTKGSTRTANTVYQATATGWVYMEQQINAKNTEGSSYRGTSKSAVTTKFMKYFTGGGTNYSTSYMMPIQKGMYYKLAHAGVFYPCV